MNRLNLPPIFLVCAQEEAPRAEALANILRAYGLDVTLDGAAAEAASCLLLLWSAAARGPEGERLRAWSAWGQARDRLIRVTLDGTTPTLAAHETPPFDLTDWDGNPQAPAFQALLAALSDLLGTELGTFGASALRLPHHAPQAATVPPPVPATWQPVQAHQAPGATAATVEPTPHSPWRLGLIVLGTLILAAVAVLVVDLMGVQKKLCEMPWNQPNLADTCGAWGLGRQPTKAERVAWAERPSGSCDAVREHVQRFPNGAFRAVASEMLATAKAEATGKFYQAPSQKPGFVAFPNSGQADEAAARREVLARAQVDAVTLLCGFTEEEERLLGVRVEPTNFECRPQGDGKPGCSLEYTAHCNVEQPTRQERCD